MTKALADLIGSQDSVRAREWFVQPESPDELRIVKPLGVSDDSYSSAVIPSSVGSQNRMICLESPHIRPLITHNA